MWKTIGSQASLLGVSTLIALSTANAASAQSIANPSFEVDLVPNLKASGPTIETSGDNPGFVTVIDDRIFGWESSAANQGIEIWQSGFQGVNAANAANGTQFAEINATVAASLFQDLTIGAAATPLYFDFWHRARDNGLPQINAIRLTITDSGADASVGSGDDVVLFSKIFATELTTNLGANQGWVNYSNIPTSVDFPILGGITAAAGVARPIRFEYTALTGDVTADIFKTSGGGTTLSNTLVTTTNVATFGNFLDNANFSTDPTFPPAPVPFDFSPNLGIGILGGLFVANKAFKSWKKSKNENS